MLKPSIEERRRYIADMATDIFLEKGYSASSLQDIAQAVGVSKAGLYHYYKSKESILYHILISEHMENLQIYEDAKAELLSPEYDDETRLKNALKLHAQLSVKNRKLGMLASIPIIKDKYDINAIVFMIIGMNVRIGSWLKENGERSLEEIIDQNIDTICHGMLKP